MAISDITPAPGVLLVAPPMLHDPNFWRSVILLCEHGEEGSFGLILNRPLSVNLNELIEDINGDNKVLLGGPVQPDTLHFLHRHGEAVASAIPVLEGVHWGGDFEVIRDLVDAKLMLPQDVRFFVGYAGWIPGQLESEIRSGGWFLSLAQEALVFSDEPGKLWSTTLRQMGGEYALIANFPVDPRLN